MDTSSANKVIVALLFALAAAACRPGNPAPPPPAHLRDNRWHGIPERQLRPFVTPEFQSEVMIFGTAHLDEYRDELKPAYLASTLNALERFCPTRIAVEVLPADEVSVLHEHATRDAGAAEQLEVFAKHIVELGSIAQEKLGLNRIEARRELAPLLKNAAALGVEERVRLILLMLAAYEYPTALLQWSYLASEVRADSRLPAEVREQLDARLGSGNEVSLIAIELARALGLQEIHAIDSQFDGIRTLAMPQTALEDLYSRPARHAWRNSDSFREYERLRQQDFANGDLLPYFRRMNSPEHMEHSVLQWQWLFETNHDSGLDRFRYATWELRNQRIASNVIDAAAAVRPERLLVIIGASHKADLDAALSGLLSVRLRHFEEFVVPPRRTAQMARCSLSR